MPNSLNLNEMHERHRALTPAIAGGYREAASVCLSRYHSSPIEIKLVDNEVESSAELSWETPDSRVLDAWANTTDATEAAAYCCVIAGIELLRARYAISRAETGTGADYYIGPKGQARPDLEDCVRLEVSGVGSGDHEEVIRRVNKKVRQAQEGDSDLPALAGVFGFRAKLFVLRDVKEQR